MMVNDFHFPPSTPKAPADESAGAFSCPSDDQGYGMATPLSGRLDGQAGLAGVEAAVAVCPAAQAVAGVLCQRGERDGQHRAVGVGQAVAADRAAQQSPQAAPAPSADNHDVARPTGQAGQYLAGLAAPHHRLGGEASGQATEGAVEGVPEQLPGITFP